MRATRDSSGALQTEAFVVFVLLDVGFRLVGFSRTLRFVRSWGQGANVAGFAGRNNLVDDTLDAVRAATRYYWRRRLDCLPRSLTIYLLLRRRGIPATLHIGVKRYPFGAHAWVECEGQVLDDSRNPWRHEPYVPIISV